VPHDSSGIGHPACQDLIHPASLARSAGHFHPSAWGRAQVLDAGPTSPKRFAMIVCDGDDLLEGFEAGHLS
jgi:hypothetical protein